MKASPPIDAEELNTFFARQAEQTKPLRRYLYRKVELARKENILDAGCGTGVVTAEIAEKTKGKVTGVDKDGTLLEFAKANFPAVDFIEADCSSLPFDDENFDLVVFHFLLIWVKNPVEIVTELTRLLRPGGILLASAEIDFGGRVEYPVNPDFASAFDSSLAQHGADIEIGRKVATVFKSAGLRVEAGLSSTLLTGFALMRDFDSNRATYMRDLTFVMDSKEAERILDLEKRQIEEGKILSIPIFWAIGRKP